MRGLLIGAGLLGLGVLGGCSSDNQCRPSLDGGSPEEPCRNAATATDGGAMTGAQCFVQAQICPGKGGFPFCERAVGSSRRDSVELQNPGQKPLTIFAIRSRGDTACAFMDPELSDEQTVPVTVGPQESVLFSFRFVPPQVGQYNALLEIESDAENYPVLRIPVCGVGVSPDAGVNPTDDGGVQVCGLPMCEDRSGADVSNCWNGWGEPGTSAQDGGT